MFFSVCFAFVVSGLNVVFQDLRQPTMPRPLISLYGINYYNLSAISKEWLGSRAVSVLDSGAEGPEFISQPRRCRITVLGKLFTPIVPLFTKQRNW